MEPCSGEAYGLLSIVDQICQLIATVKLAEPEISVVANGNLALPLTTRSGLHGEEGELGQP